MQTSGAREFHEELGNLGVNISCRPHRTTPVSLAFYSLDS